MNKPVFNKFNRQLNIMIYMGTGVQGKSTFANIVFAPRMLDLAEIFHIESESSTPQVRTESDFYNAENLDSIQQKLLLNSGKSHILDFGTSDQRNLKDMFSQYTNLFNLIDYFVVPVALVTYRHDDFVRTMETLVKDSGIDPRKIKVVLNMVPFRLRESALRAACSKIVETTNLLGIEFNENHIVPEFECITKMNGFEPPIIYQELMDDDQDFTQLIRQAENDDQRQFLALLATIQGLAFNMTTTLNKSVATIFEGEIQ